MFNKNTLRQFARQLYLDGLLDLRSVNRLMKEYAPISDIDVQYFELLGHVVDTVKAAKATHAKSRREELKKPKEKALCEIITNK